MTPEEALKAFEAAPEVTQEDALSAWEAAPAVDAPSPFTPEERAKLDEINANLGPSAKERTLGSIVSFLSGSPLFGTVARAAGALPEVDLPVFGKVTGGGERRFTNAATQATEQFSPKVAGVPVLPVLGGIAATLPAGAANIAPRAGAALLGTRGAMAARVGLQGGLGGVQAADRGGGLGDVAAGAGIGALGGALGEGLGAVGRRIIKGAASRVGDVVAGRAASDVADVAADVAAAEGKYGAAAQALNRTNENLTRHVAGLPSASGSLLPAQTQQKALTTLTDPDTIAALTQIAERDVANLPAKTAEYLRTQAAAQALRAGAPVEAAKRTQDYFAAPLLKTEVLPRLGALAQRGGVATAAGGVSGLLGAGGALATGQDPLKVGMMTGAAGFGSVMGGQGLLTMGRNLAKSPRVQRAALEGVVSGIESTGAGLRRMGTVRPDYGNTAKQALDADEQDGIDAFLSNSP